MNSGLASQPRSTDRQRGHSGPLSGHGGTALLGPACALVGQEGSGRAGSGPCRAVYPGADGALAPARSERRDGRSAGPTARCVAAGAGLPATCARCLRRDGAEWDGEAPEEMWQREERRGWGRVTEGSQRPRPAAAHGIRSMRTLCPPHRRGPRPRAIGYSTHLLARGSPTHP